MIVLIAYAINFECFNAADCSYILFMWVFCIRRFGKLLNTM
jgi:hypothetical protein